VARRWPLGCAGRVFTINVVAVEGVDLCRTAGDIFESLAVAEVGVPFLVEALAAFDGRIGVIKNSHR
jgi:flavin reductase (DIM6/NTAB) family NADH-FMN oxidoreductase RutF